jgi:septation ring formation regulator EzrA|tara:strand:+ start:94 stop:387 length:294 start_codon:yes stop_codon:yes gene_type:complete
MSKSRVSITHSVELENVPTVVGDLINKTYDSDYRSLAKEFEELLDHIRKQNERMALQKIEAIRKKLMNIDFCMDDSYNILSSYQKHLLDDKQDDDDA